MSFIKLINIVYFWPCWVLVAAHRLAAHSCGEWRPLFIAMLGLLLLQSTGSRHVGSVAAAHGPSCPTACGTFLDQGSMSPALASGFLTTGPSRKSRPTFLVSLTLDYYEKIIRADELDPGGL